MTRPICYHQTKKVVWTRVNTHGEPLAVRQLRHQCLDCGRLLSNAIPFSAATAATPEVDLEAIKKWAENDQAQWTKQRIESAELTRLRVSERRQLYDAYLQSDAWRDKRELVFERCQGLCEGCRQQQATAVHHLTYDHLGNELLWELTAVCRECHQRAHNLPT